MANKRRRRGTKKKPFLLLALMLIVAAVAADAANRGALFKQTVPYFDEIEAQCREIGEDLALVLAVIHTESRFRPDAVSPRGAVGLMQIMPDTGRWMAERIGREGYTEDKLYEREWNLAIGISYIQYLRRQFPGSVTTALAAYNAGPSKVQSWIRAGEWDGSYAQVEDIPYGETKNYIKKVMQSYEKYRKIYDSDIGASAGAGNNLASRRYTWYTD